ncbi:hypothetical protein Terro_4278 [Terriglobus roseus DSM 18391]|uniref:Uncharacterized protein n=1 Tax=Terriglobus roseus (strain DSM 18391 / NRRL B-41598 / KBS 63) TaxID=926566 RepID=I3ZML1_TERRK|nr:hypothetical protein [Terriglobus roseus]AFL90479.1 hypothetical protein Terro_4278 [Terriglobus roseus DSM 18391]
MSIIRSVSIASLVLSCAVCVAQAGPTAFTMPQTTAVPGGILQSGDYIIQIVDHLSDRSVVEVTSQGKASKLTFLAVEASSASVAAASGPVLWSKGAHGQRSLRGFNFSTGQRFEFVYPKDDAVALANANKESVVAVDTASEKRPELSKLSPSDLQLVTLWSLTPVRIGADSAALKGIEAKRFIANTNTNGNGNQSGQLTAASVTPTSPTSGAAPATRSTTLQPVLTASLERPQPVIRANRGAYVKRLPKTAGYTPLAGFLAVISLVGALCMRLRRTV